MATHLVHKQTTAVVRAMFRMETAYAYASLMDSGLEVNLLVKVRSCLHNVCAFVYVHVHDFVYTLACAIYIWMWIST